MMSASLLQEIGKPEAAIAPLGDPATEEALVATAKGGNPQAFETLVQRYRQKILAIALRYTRIQEDAEDVVQQAFQKAFIHLKEFEGKSSFSTWLTRIAINEALMLMRRFRALRQVSLEDSNSHEGGASALEIPDASPDPETSYFQQEGAKILTTAMAQLRPGLRTAIELRELAELSTEETARHMGLSVGAVKARLFHARRKLRDRLSRHFRARRISKKCNGRFTGRGFKSPRRPLQSRFRIERHGLRSHGHRHAPAGQKGAIAAAYKVAALDGLFLGALYATSFFPIVEPLD